MTWTKQAIEAAKKRYVSDNYPKNFAGNISDIGFMCRVKDAAILADAFVAQQQLQTVIERLLTEENQWTPWICRKNPTRGDVLDLLRVLG